MASTCSDFCSPMNFNVICRDSGRTQRASGAKPCTPSRKRAMRTRTSGSRSMPMNIRIFKILMLCGDGPLARSRSDEAEPSLHTKASQQRPADHLQCLLRCELADALAVAGEVALHNLRAFFTRQCDVDQADRFLFSSAARAGDAGDSDSVARQAALANAFGQSRGNFAADRAVLIDQRLGNVRKLRLQRVRANHRDANKIARTAADRGDALCQ